MRVTGAFGFRSSFFCAGGFFVGDEFGAGGAEFQEGALFAAGFAGEADLAAVENEEMGEEGPVVLGDDFHQVLFDFDGIGVCGEVEALGEASDVGIDDDADILVEGVSQDDIGGFSTDAAEGGEFLHGLGDLAVVFLDDVGGGGADGGGFAAEEAGGLDDFFDVGLGGFGECFGGRVFFEEDGSNHIDAHIGALGGEDGGDEEFVSIAMIERAVGVGIKALEFGENLGGAGFFLFKRFSRHLGVRH
jgi:hypothetical protein